MTGILAIETATDSCSVAVYLNGQINQRCEEAPRQHSQLVFAMLSELLEKGGLAQQGIQVIAYGSGPGSFTGLRIAASLVQGLAYSCELPALAVPTLAVLAQGALENGLVKHDDTVLCLLDARINEVYSAIYCFEAGIAVLQQGPFATSPDQLSIRGTADMIAVGNGCRFLDRLPQSLQARILSSAAELAPHARDMFPLALHKFELGEIQSAGKVQPLYVRDEISWKKLAQQGKQI
ncbi:MAG: tRNA (adenosine(37)-N6)-threonylcarbamoyltransferase complex dimerization subunit type 1 TsaB [Halioglobus sp.]